MTTFMETDKGSQIRRPKEANSSKAQARCAPAMNALTQWGLAGQLQALLPSLLLLALATSKLSGQDFYTTITVVNLSTNPVSNVGFACRDPSSSDRVGTFSYTSAIPTGGSKVFSPDQWDKIPRTGFETIYPRSPYWAIYNFSPYPGGPQLPTSAQFPGSQVTFYITDVPAIDDPTDGARKKPGPPGCGMPIWSVSEPYISLWLQDEPLGYQPGLGPRVSFELAFKQRESAAGIIPNTYGVGARWNCSWLSYVEPDLNNSNVVHFPGGGQRTYYGTNDYLTNTRLWGTANTGFTNSYPDGSTNVYNFIVTNSSGTFLQAFLTESLNPQGQKLSFYYSAYNNAAPVVRLQFIVDGDGLTNIISYNPTNTFSTNLISQVTDPYGRSAFLAYDDRGRLTNLTDVIGISTSFTYDTNDVVTSMTTPYGVSSFTYTDTTGTNVAPNGRSMLVNEPDGGTHLFLYQDYAAGITNSYPSSLVPVTTGFSNSFDDLQLNVRNSFHWGRQQYAALSTTNISLFTAADFRKARMQHWLCTGSGSVGEVLSVQREPSPDAAGSTDAQKTWYDYAGKTNSQYEGGQALPLFVAQVLPDGSTHLVRTDRNSNGFPTDEITSYSAGGSILLRTNTFTYSNAVDVITITNALGVQISSNAYNAYHQVVTNFDALGELTVLLYNANQQVVSITRPSGLVTTNVYSSGNSSNRLASTTDYAIVGGIPVYYRTNSYTWTGGLVATHTDPMGLMVTNTWDKLQRLRRVDFPDQTFITNVFANLDLVQVVDRLGYTNSFGYDPIRRLVAATNANSLVTRYGYCTCGALNAVTNAFGTSLQNVTTYAWDLQSHILQSVGPDLFTVTYNYNALGQATNVYDGLGSVTNWYNNQGLLVASSNAFGQLSAAVYDILDRVTNSVDANTVTITNTFDSLNRLVTCGYPDGGVESYVYTLNVAGPTSYTNQLKTNVVNFTYDPLNRKTVEVYPGVTTNSFAYDGANHLHTTTDGNGQTTTWAYDLYGRLVTKMDATSTVILTNAYDPDNRLTNRWTIAKANTIYSYDAAGNLTAIQYPVSHGIRYYYDLLNRLTNMVDAVGSSYFSYTVASELASEDGPWVDDTVGFTYSSATRLRTGLSLIQPNNSPWVQSYGYDSAERLQSITSPAGSFGYGYDPVKQVMVNSLSLPNAAYITNSFDSVGRLLGTLLKNSTNGVLNSHQYAYNIAGQRTYLTNMAGDYRSYIYDNIGQLTNVFGHEANGAARANEYLSYTFDPAGNLKSRYVLTTTETFNVNSVNELTSQWRSGSTFTVAGTTTGSATNVLLTPNGGIPFSVTPYADNTWGVGVGLNAGTNTFVAVAQDLRGRTDTNTVTCYLPVTNLFSYDGNGNLLSDGNRNFAYDDENQLISVWQTNAWRSDFVYDGKMRRRIRREYTWSGGAWLQTNEVHYIYDGNLVVQERDLNNVPTLSYTRGRDLSGRLQGAGGIGGLLAMSQGSGVFPQHLFYHADGSGNITCLINSNQAIVARYLYDPFGNILSKAGLLADANVYRFSSKELHISSGLLCYGYRFYDPGMQRWLNRDPIGEYGGHNLYAFSANDPVNLYDGMGLDPSLAQLFLQSIAQNGLSDLSRFAGTVASDAANFAVSAVVKQANTIYQFNTDPFGFLQSQFQDLQNAYQAVANTGAYLGRLSADPCERQRASAALQNALANPETYGHGVFAAESFLAAGLFAPEAAAAENTAIRWGPLNGPGPLGESVANTFRGGSYTESVLSEDTTLYRVYGGNSQQIGPYWTRTAPTGPLQSTIDSALNPAWGNTAQNVTSMVVPKGTTIYEGFAAPQGGLVGGGSQVVIPNVNPAWLVKP